MNFLAEILNNPQRVVKLFKASDHYFDAKLFHQRCDHRKDTLVLILTEFNKVIGGFTHYPWDCENGWLSDRKRRSFVFSLDKMEI